MGSKETLARNWSFHFSQVNYISLFTFVVDKDLSKNSCLTHATTVLSVLYQGTMSRLNGLGSWKLKGNYQIIGYILGLYRGNGE